MAIAFLVDRKNEPIMNVGRYGFVKSSIAENPKGYRVRAINTTVDWMKQSNTWLKLYIRYISYKNYIS